MPRKSALSLALLVTAASACGGAQENLVVEPSGPPPTPGNPAQVAQEPPGSPAAQKAKQAPLARPSGPLTREQAERYFLDMVNRDRAAHGLGPVKWDAAAAESGRRHAANMMANAFTAHIGVDGSVPEQRYTAAGGEDFVMENVACSSDGAGHPPVAEPRFSAADLEQLENAFMSEVPPRDGHKRNILNPRHTSVGIGLAQGGPGTCVAQEFVDDYGEYDPIPRKVRLGKEVRVSGIVRAPASFAGVGLSRIDPAKPKTVEEVRKTHGYSIPGPYQLFHTAGYKTPRVVETNATPGWFRVDVPLDKDRRPGRYGVSVWATFPGSRELVMVSLRIVDVE